MQAPNTCCTALTRKDKPAEAQAWCHIVAVEEGVDATQTGKHHRRIFCTQLEMEHTAPGLSSFIKGLF